MSVRAAKPTATRRGARWACPTRNAAWRAVGVPYAERGKRTDQALRLLPSLVEGRATDVDGEQVTLAPAAPMPPVLVGGGRVGRRRAAQHGNAWMPAFLTPQAVAVGVRELADLAAKYDRPVPSVTVSVRVALGDQPASVIDQGIRTLVAYGLSEADARTSMITGSPARAAEKLAELAQAGATRVVGMPFTDDRPRQAELLAEAARLTTVSE
ncbi:MAG: LLM class flavin-dependent oxidoreductase [Umezawaea sp.]